jgi:hypothetical protein
MISQESDVFKMQYFLRNVGIHASHYTVPSLETII